MRKKVKSSRKKYLLATFVVVLLAIGIVAILEATNTTYFFNTPTTINEDKKSPVTASTSKPTAHQLPTTTDNTRSGGITDQHGQTGVALPPSSQWVSSSSGNVTLQQPSSNTVIKSGDTLSGLAKVSTVQFILVDDSVGQIAQGSLSVVNGKFSGILQFTPHASSGKLEVYYPNPTNGAEEDLIKINVGFDN